MATTPSNLFLLDVNFDKSTIELHLIFISSILAKFSKSKINSYVINQMFKFQVFVF